MNAIIGTGKLSQRKYGITIERNISIPMSDGVNMDVDIFRPADTEERFPVLVAMSPYDKEAQSDRVWPVSIGTADVRGSTNGGMEAGPSDFFVRRGYVHIKASARGTGKSGGVYQWISPREIKDMYDLVEWAASQPWCSGNVGMIGISYYGWIQALTAALQPPHLKCIFPFNAATDQYRMLWYHGGIRWESFVAHLLNLKTLDIHSDESMMKEELGEEAFQAAIDKLLEDEETCANPIFVDALKHPDKLGNSLKIDILLNDTADTKYWAERHPDFNNIEIPVYCGASWHKFPLHLPGAFDQWANLKVSKKLLIGPPYGPDRPLYQLQWEMLRWYDHWLKGIDTGIMDEPAVKLFVRGSNEWKYTDDWPVPGTSWIPFFLHSQGILSEMEPWPDAPSATFKDSPAEHGSLKYYSPRLVEDTEVCGPIALNLYASSRDQDIYFFVSLWDVDESNNETLLTRGWLKGSHLALDPEKSKPYQPYHPHTRAEPLVSGRVYKFPIEIVPTANMFKYGHKIMLKICCADNEKSPNNPHEQILTGHSWRQTENKITVLHDADHPSNLLLPITKGNVIGTYMSGGLLG